MENSDIANLRQRMYCLVLRQLSPIQKGVQSAHAIVEYSNNFGNTQEWKRWSEVDKTLIMLDGGTYPELAAAVAELDALCVRTAHFDEEDLNYLTTCVCLLADERVWDRKKYPDWDPCPPSPSYKTSDGVTVIQSVYIQPEPIEKWVERVGGQANARIREIIGSLRLAL